MGTKANPGPYSAYDLAEPDEPVFTLIARDPAAPAIIREWVARRLRAGNLSVNQSDAAIATAREMELWCAANRVGPFPGDE